MSRLFRAAEAAAISAKPRTAIQFPTLTKLFAKKTPTAPEFIESAGKDFMQSLHKFFPKATPPIRRNSLEEGIRIMSMKTLRDRMLREFEVTSNFKDKAPREKVVIAPSYTTHPTAGQTQETRRLRRGMSRVTLLTASAIAEGKASAAAIVELARIAKDFDIKTSIIEVAKKFELTTEDFAHEAKSIRDELIRKFTNNPVFPEKQLTQADEREMLLEALRVSRENISNLTIKFPEALSMVEYAGKTWAGDRDGRPTKPGHTTAFTKKSQDDFFNYLKEFCEDYSATIELEGGNKSVFEENVTNKIKEISASVSEEILIGDEGKTIEEEIRKILSDYKSTKDGVVGNKFLAAEVYVKSSNCRTAPDTFTTREESQKTTDSFEEIVELCLTKDESLKAEIADKIKHEKDSEEYKEEVARFFLRNASDPRIIKAFSENFHELSAESARQFACNIEALFANKKHEHIEAQSPCKKSAFLQTAAFFELSKSVQSTIAEAAAENPENPTALRLKKLYAENSEMLGIDIFAQIFSEKATTVILESNVGISTLAEDRFEIAGLSSYIKKLLADPDCFAIFEKFGAVPITEGRSDSSAIFGSYTSIFYNLRNYGIILKVAKELGIDVRRLSGLGNDDANRLAEALLKNSPNRLTVQGGDIENYITISRILLMILQGSQNKSQEEYAKLIGTYGETAVRDLIKFYHREHVISEFGAKVLHDGEIIDSARLTGASPIIDGVLKAATVLSSRPGSRKEGGEEDHSIEPNDLDFFGKHVARLPRRIGAVSAMEARGGANFHEASHAKTPPFDAQLVCDLHKIPAFFNNIAMSLLSLGDSDSKCYLIANGIDGAYWPHLDRFIPDYAEKFEELTKLQIEGKEEEAKEYASENGLDDPSVLRAAHVFYHIKNKRNVLRNAITPLIHESSTEIKERLGDLFDRVESGELLQDYYEPLMQALEILTHDPKIVTENRIALACVAQQIHDNRKPGYYYDTRRTLIQEADKISAEGVEIDKIAAEKKLSDEETASLRSENRKKFKEICTQAVALRRGNENPQFPGVKAEEYFMSNVRERGNPFPMDHLLEEEVFLATSPSTTPKSSGVLTAESLASRRGVELR